MSTEEVTVDSNKIAFKKKTLKRQLRKNRCSSDEDNDDKSDVGQLENIKERQKLRQRHKGINVYVLALGKKIALEDQLTMKDALNMKNGGLVNMKCLRKARLKAQEDEYDVDIGTQFSAETNKRDEDEEMMKYIENELEKRKGLDDPNKEDEICKYMSPEDAALFALPEHLRKSTSYRSEEMLSFQMLNGIPEVDLGIDSKIKNIEATEDAKQKLIQARLNKQDLPSHFVPTNMAVNFMQHNRFDIEENSRDRRKRYHNNNNANGMLPPPTTTSTATTKSSQMTTKSQGNNSTDKLENEPQNETNKTQQQQTQQKRPQQSQNHYNRNHVGPNGVKRATDDYYYDKFKKQFRRY